MHPKAVIEAETVGELANETLSIVELLLGHDRYWILGRMLRPIALSGSKCSPLPPPHWGCRSNPERVRGD